MAPSVAEDLLRNTPSRGDGIRASKEERLRIYGADRIQRAAVLLKVPQSTASSAAVIFQRFYFKKSFADFDVRVTASAALLLACKLEETQRRLRDVVMVCHRLDLREMRELGVPLFSGRPVPVLESASREYIEAKQEVVRVERSILRETGFAVALLLEHPHKYVLQFVNSLKRSEGLAQLAWNHLNDGMRTALCCAYQPHELASASIYLAARQLRLKLPEDPPWWSVFDTELEDMRRIAGELMRLARRRPARWSPVNRTRLQIGLGTPADTPGPLRSPSDDEKLSGGLSGSGLPPPSPAVDPRIAEMLSEVEPGRSRSRSRSGKRRLVRVPSSVRGRKG